MKTKKLFLPLALVAATALFSCSTDNEEITNGNLENTSISNLSPDSISELFTITTGERFKFDLELADDEKATILKGALNASVNRINRFGKYAYESEEGFTGTENILIEIESAASGTDLNGSSRYVELEITVEQDSSKLDELIASAIKVNISTHPGLETIVPLPIGDEGSPSILVSPNNATTSQLAAPFSYVYQAAGNFEGTDSVLIEIEDDFAAQPLTYIYITFTVEVLTVE